MTDPRHNLRDVYPPTGTGISTKSWLTEAPMRMLMNNLHPDVAESPHELVVYGGMGRAARTWDDFDRIVRQRSRALAESEAQLRNKNRELERLTPGERIRIDDEEGTVIEIHTTGVDIATAEGVVTIPAARFAELKLLRPHEDGSGE